MRTLLIGLVLALGFATPAHARAHALRASISVPALPAPMPQIVIGHCPGLDDASGCYDSGTNTVYALSRERFPLDHEIGHAFDATAMDAAERQQFADALSKPNAPWWETSDEGGVLVTSVGSLGEVFANAYASCRMRLVPSRGATWYYNAYEYRPGVRAQLRICTLIAAAADSPGTPVDPSGWR